MGEKRKLLAPGQLAARLKRVSAPNTVHRNHQQPVNGKGQHLSAQKVSGGAEDDVQKDLIGEASDLEAADVGEAQVRPVFCVCSWYFCV